MRVVRTHRSADDNPALRLLSSGCSTPVMKQKPIPESTTVQHPALADLEHARSGVEQPELSRRKAGLSSASMSSHNSHGWFHIGQ